MGKILILITFGWADSCSFNLNQYRLTLTRNANKNLANVILVGANESVSRCHVCFFFSNCFIPIEVPICKSNETCAC